jgi:hypothetical protein
MSTVSGWLAMLLAVLALAPGIVPGAMSLFGLGLSLLALIVSLSSVREKGKYYLRTTLIIVLIEIFLVNDSLRIWAQQPMPQAVRLTLYGIVLLVLVACTLVADRLVPEHHR